MARPPAYKGFQVTFDAADPARLAQFWAIALRYEVEPPPDGFATWPDALKAWGVPEDKWNSASALVDPEGVGPRLFIQQVPEGKTAKNRVHLDVRAARGAELEPAEQERVRDEHVARLVEAGAQRVEQKSELGQTWVVMLDLEGNEFCVS